MARVTHVADSVQGSFYFGRFVSLPTPHCSVCVCWGGGVVAECSVSLEISVTAVLQKSTHRSQMRQQESNWPVKKESS